MIMGFIPDTKKYNNKKVKTLAREVGKHIRKINFPKLEKEHKEWFQSFMQENNLIAGGYNITEFRFDKDSFRAVLSGYNNEVPRSYRDMLRALFFEGLPLKYSEFHAVEDGLLMTLTDHNNVHLLVDCDKLIELSKKYNLKVFVRNTIDDVKIKLHNDLSMGDIRPRYNKMKRELKDFVKKKHAEKDVKREFNIKGNTEKPRSDWSKKQPSEKMGEAIGWLDPDGFFYVCDTGEHILLAEKLVAQKYPYFKEDAECILEDHAWVKLMPGHKAIHTEDMTNEQTKEIERWENKRDVTMEIEQIS